MEIEIFASACDSDLNLCNKPDSMSDPRANNPLTVVKHNYWLYEKSL